MLCIDKANDADLRAALPVFECNGVFGLALSFVSFINGKRICFIRDADGYGIPKGLIHHIALVDLHLFRVGDCVYFGNAISHFIQDRRHLCLIGI